MPSSQSNFRTDLYQTMSLKEQALVRKWQQTPPEGELVLYPGCNILALPYLLDASFMEEITVAGSWDLCCGEMYLRMGLFDAVERRAEKLTAFYRDKKIGTMLFSCPACLHMFSKVLPGQFGARFDFKTMYLGTYLWQQVKAKKIRIQNKLSRTVTIHDSCHARVMGSDVINDSRLLLQECGLELLEMEPGRKEGLCCGAAAGARRHNPFDILFTAVGALREGKKTRAEEIALYCGGCQLALNLARLLYFSRQPVRHLLEYLQEACCEGNYRPVKKRSLVMLLNILFKCFPRYFSSRRFWIGD